MTFPSTFPKDSGTLALILTRVTCNNCPWYRFEQTLLFGCSGEDRMGVFNPFENGKGDATARNTACRRILADVFTVFRFQLLDGREERAHER